MSWQVPPAGDFLAWQVPGTPAANPRPLTQIPSLALPFRSLTTSFPLLPQVRPALRLSTRLFVIPQVRPSTTSTLFFRLCAYFHSLLPISPVLGPPHSPSPPPSSSRRPACLLCPVRQLTCVLIESIQATHSLIHSLFGSFLPVILYRRRQSPRIDHSQRFALVSGSHVYLARPTQLDGRTESRRLSYHTTSTSTKLPVACIYPSSSPTI
ncbi:hypothetical protein F4780DRAFT_107661 [Xylariomycetidae sp. FL0641]|nr:hypothetical protein F4780DRAFT_107661 [Xylariomycetidae sp. FL0641]